MTEWTGTEIQVERARLEREAATALGYILFEQTRLEMELGLFLVWKDDGSDLDKHTEKLGSVYFCERLGELQSAIALKYSSTPEAITAYTEWLGDAHKVRELRNQLVHGRWGVNPMAGTVSNVLGLPTSPTQREIPYSIKDLHEILSNWRTLRTRLATLRRAWPA